MTPSDRTAYLVVIGIMCCIMILGITLGIHVHIGGTCR